MALTRLPVKYFTAGQRDRKRRGGRAGVHGGGGVILRSAARTGEGIGGEWTISPSDGYRWLTFVGRR